MISLTQGRFGSEQVRRATGDALSQEDVNKLLTCIRNEPLKYRNRAVAVLSYHRHIRVGHVARFLGVSHSSVDNWVGRFSQHGWQLLLPFTSQYVFVGFHFRGGTRDYFTSLGGVVVPMQRNAVQEARESSSGSEPC
jgi:hypothetical protein